MQIVKLGPTKVSMSITLTVDEFVTITKSLGANDDIEMAGTYEIYRQLAKACREFSLLEEDL